MGLVWGAGLDPSRLGTVSHDLIHVSDWYFTLQEAAAAGVNASEAEAERSVEHMRWLDTLRSGTPAGGDVPFNSAVDGVSVWPTLSAGAPSPRKSVVFYASPLDRSTVTGAYIQWPWKLIEGNDDFGLMEGNDWFLTPGLSFSMNFTTNCPFPPPAKACDPTSAPCLFNLETDPCEHVSVAGSQPAVLAELRAAIRDIQQSSSPDRSQGEQDPKCLPSTPRHNGSWYPCDSVARG